MGKQLSRAHRELPEQREFGGGQMHQAAGLGDPPPLQVDLDVPDPHDARLRPAVGRRLLRRSVALIRASNSSMPNGLVM